MTSGLVLVPESPSTRVHESIAVLDVPVRRPRVRAVDLMRLVAAVSMIEGHVFTVALEPRVRGAGWYAWHEVVHGFTAPMFLFAAGLAFGITSLGRERASTSIDVHGPRFERYASLLFFGYFLHLGRTTLTELGTLDDPTRHRLLLVDALQCIGVTLGVAQLALAAIRSRKAFLVATGGLALGVVLLAPATERLGSVYADAWFGPYLNHATGSLFPLFPWSAYVFVGIVASRIVVAPFGRITRFAGAGLVAILLAVVLARSAPDAFGSHEFWRSSPYLFLGRIGVLFLVFAALSVADREDGPSDGAGARFARQLSGETLCLYLVHLAILYGTPLTRSLRRVVAGRLDLVEASLLFVVILVVSLAAALVSATVDERHPGRLDALRRVFIVAVLVRFVSRS